MKDFIIRILASYYPEVLFEYKNNRRYCKRCGQQQDLWGHSWSWHSHNWWEDMLPIPDENCLCHKFSRRV